ncbi:MAG: cation-translocating P-type ATPase [Patescibacteria group bacterium]
MEIDFHHYQGLTAEEVEKQRKIMGLNVLFAKKRKGFWQYAIQILKEPMLLLLLATALIYFTIGSGWDGVLMIIGVLVMIGIDLYQEAKTDKALEALQELSTPKISVIRDGHLQIIKNEELVMGDVLIAREGERIAGDGLIFESSNFSIDESMLTGESGAIYKTNAGEGTSNANQDSNTVFAGTLVLTGQAVIQVTATGGQTQYGKIGTSLAEIHEPATPLQIKTGRLVKIFGFTGLGACVALFLINFAQDHGFVDSLLKGLTLAISVIPEELPVVLTVFSALGAYRLTKKNALIRKITTIETLGSITTLCTDKTGTLTMNRMELQKLCTASDGCIKINSVDARQPEFDHVFLQSMLACQPEPFDPIDVSIFESARQAGVKKDAKDRYAIIREYGFDQSLRAMGYAWKTDEGITVAIKGSAEQLIEHCELSEAVRKELLMRVDELSAQGLRVLAVVQKSLPDGRPPAKIENISDYAFVALLGFHDPPKAQAKQAILACLRAGITVRMITGDHPQTALHIAQAVGIKHKNRFITGQEIESLTEEALVERMKDVYVFARIIPEQKLKIVRALQRAGEVVAMIGDGVNDAPSLKEADVGIAMGLQGTNVAREASDMILMDDQLNTVVGAIHDGRRIFDNIQKSITYIFGIHVYIILIALLIPLMGLPALLLPIHIVLIELIIDPTCSLVFEAMPAESDIMKRKPRDPKQPLLSSKTFVRIFLNGLCIFFLTAFVYFISLRTGASTETARTLGFSIILWSNLFNVLSFVSRTKPIIFTLAFIKNKAFASIYAIMLVFFISLVYLPKINVRLGLTSIPIPWFLFTLFLGFLPAFVNDLYKKAKTREI